MPTAVGFTLSRGPKAPGKQLMVWPHVIQAAFRPAGPVLASGRPEQPMLGCLSSRWDFCLIVFHSGLWLLNKLVPNLVTRKDIFAHESTVRQSLVGTALSASCLVCLSHSVLTQPSLKCLALGWTLHTWPPHVACASSQRGSWREPWKLYLFKDLVLDITQGCLCGLEWS